MFMAGATLVGMGSAVRYRGIHVFDLVYRELTDWLAAHHFTRDDIIGAAHDPIAGPDSTAKKSRKTP
jgi:dihydroorotate dehydrogenase (NAD+) catalytic subunit